MSNCAFCGERAEGKYAVHRDGFGVGPEVDLCDACGGSEFPTLAQIWDAIAQPADDECAYRSKPA